jgi:hypothetical protein
MIRSLNTAGGLEFDADGGLGLNADYHLQDAKAWQERYGIELPPWEELTTGAIIGVVEVMDCVRSQCEGSLWAEPDSWCWVLRNPVPFPEPIVFRGSQGLFDMHADSLAGTNSHDLSSDGE